MFPSDPLFPSTTRSIAIISDIHGNIRALDAVLDDIAAADVDAVVCNGDHVTSSAHAEAVVRRLRALGIPSTRGNHERYLCELDDPDDHKWRQDNWRPTRHDYLTLSDSDRTWLQTLPETLWLVDGASPIYMAHATPGDDRARVTAQTSDEAWESLFSGLPPRSTLVGSHLHWYFQHQWRDCRFIRTPAAGLPLDGDTRAGYVILRRMGGDWQVEVRRVAYDLAGELDSFRRSDYYAEGGIIAQLFWEELRTACWRIVPFFAHVRRVCSSNDLTPDPGGFNAEDMAAALRSFDQSHYPEYQPDGEIDW